MSLKMLQTFCFISIFIFLLLPLNGKLIFPLLFVSNLFLLTFLIKKLSTKSFLTAICWWRFIWKSAGKSCSARLFIAQKRCTRPKWSSRKWRRTILKSLSKRWVCLGIKLNWKLRKMLEYTRIEAENRWRIFYDINIMRSFIYLAHSRPQRLVLKPSPVTETYNVKVLLNISSRWSLFRVLKPYVRRRQNA